MLDLLTTYANVSELQAFAVPPLISTIHKSPEHPLSLFQPAMSSPAFPWQWLQTVEIIQLHVQKPTLNGCSVPTASFPHRHPYRIDLVTPGVVKMTSRHRPRRNTPFPTVPLLLHIDSLLWGLVYRAIG
jgi:hypothetical protein